MTLDSEIASAYQELQNVHGSQKNDYYALVYFESILKIPRADAANQIAWGGFDLGIDGFSYNPDTRTFHIYQFKNTSSINTFKESLKRIESAAIPALFSVSTDKPTNPIIDAARTELKNRKYEISAISIDFVFRGDPDEPNNSTTIQNISENLVESSLWSVQKYLESESSIPIEVRFLKFDRIPAKLPLTDIFKVRYFVSSYFPEMKDPGLVLGFIPLVELHKIYKILDRSFLEKNIRYALPPDGHVNNALRRAFREIAIKKTLSPHLFSLHHNGVTLSAKEVLQDGDFHIISRPRLLNGAQTVSTFKDFMSEYEDALEANGSEDIVQEILVPCRIILGASNEQITEVTINTNRQNPVEAWQLHSNDDIQIEFEEFFKNIQIPYARQDRQYSKMPIDVLESLGYSNNRAIELVRLAKTFLCVEGEISKARNMSKIFESIDEYRKVFSSKRFNVTANEFVVCYKIVNRCGRIIGEAIEGAGKAKYWFALKGASFPLLTGLACQAFLNGSDRSEMSELYGCDLTVSHSMRKWVKSLATPAIRFMLKDIINEPKHAAQLDDLDLNFLRSSDVFLRAMKFAKTEYGWKLQKLE